MPVTKEITIKIIGIKDSKTDGKRPSSPAGGIISICTNFQRKIVEKK
jgi:hypothetical protein